jgi:FtsH-binding integral membrane protein
MTLTTLLIVLLIVALVGGFLGHGRFGYVGFSPVGVLLVILLVLYLTGNLRLR